MKILIMMLVFIGTSLAIAEGRFDRETWNNLGVKAQQRASKELSIIIHAPGWEPGKGVSFFAEDFSEGKFLMKFDPDGRLVKVAPQEDFPEVTKYNERVADLTEQFKSEYAKSIGMTLEAARIEGSTFRVVRRTGRLLGGAGEGVYTNKVKTAAGELQALKDRIREERSTRGAELTGGGAKGQEELLAKIENLIGFIKFGQAPIVGPEIMKSNYQRGAALNVHQIVQLVKPYRYMKDVRLEYADNKLFMATLSVKFGDEFSDEAIEQEQENIRKDLEGKLNLELGNRGRLTHGKVQVEISVFCKEIKLKFVDKQTFDAANMAARQRGLALPKLPEEKQSP